MEKSFEPKMNVVMFEEEDVVATSTMCFEPHACISCYESAASCDGTYDCVGFECPRYHDFD